MTTQLHNISKTPSNIKDEWRTPPEVFRWASHILGGIEFDTACASGNWLEPPIYDDFRPFTTDALAEEWFGKCWCNPPYSNIGPWIDHAIKSKNAITALLIPSPNGEARYSRLMSFAHEIVINGRLAFLRPDGTPCSGNTRGSSLFIINGYGQGSRSFVERDWVMEKYK